MEAGRESAADAGPRQDPERRLDPGPMGPGSRSSAASEPGRRRTRIDHGRTSGEMVVLKMTKGRAVV